MKKAIVLGKKAKHGCHFGCVIVDLYTKKIIAEGFNHGSENPVLHGEIVAINDFANKCSESGNASLNTLPPISKFSKKKFFFGLQ
jgi:tRNA(Arg) A34 adenosine deaminase TadA